MAHAIRLNGSPRDHTADADPNVSRKRARLSEDGHSPQSSDDGQDSEVQIEALAPEPIDSDLGSAIEIDGDEYNDMMSCSFSLSMYTDANPVDQLRNLRDDVSRDFYLSTNPVVELSRWLRQFLEDPRSSSNDRLFREYLHDSPFFGEMALLAHSLLRRIDWFDSDKTDYTQLGAILHGLLNDLATLAVRFVALLPFITKEKLAHRDSTQNRARPQHVMPALHFVNVFSLLCCGTAACVQSFKLDFGLKEQVAVRKWRSLLDQQVLQLLVELFCDVAHNAREIKDSWSALDAILKAIDGAPIAKGAANVLAAVNESVLPIICEKHPRALPDGFHATVVTVAAGVLREQTSGASLDDGFVLYERFVKSEGDALLPGMAIDVTQLEAMKLVCEGNKDALAALLSATWTLQTYKAFIFSSIMDVRSCGISLMSTQLVYWFNISRKTVDEGIDKAVVDYAARFMRVNDLTLYIFSPDSHASIVSHSNEIIAFLGATSTYTNHETDIMWQACSTSVEADFAKAAIDVLSYVSQYLGYQQLLYAARKFLEAPIAMLREAGPADLLANLLRRLRKQCRQEEQSDLAQDASALAMNILRRLHSEDNMPMARRAWGVAMTEISHLLEMNTEDRLRLYELCVPDIVTQTDWATCSYLVLNLFLAGMSSDVEAKRLLSMLPLVAVVDEMRQNVRHVAQNSSIVIEARMAMIEARLDVAVLLMSLNSYERDPSAEDRLFDILLGDQAPDNYVRQHVWSKLGSMRAPESPFKAAGFLLDHYMGTKVLTLSTTHMTKSLIAHMVPLIEDHVRSAIQDDSPSQLLQNPLWEAVVRAATKCRDYHVSAFASQVVCHLLFALPSTLGLGSAAIVRCQTSFMRSYIENMCAVYGETAYLEEYENVLNFCQSVSLLNAVLKTSRDTRDFYRIDGPQKTYTLASKGNEAGDLHLTALVNYPCKPQDTISIRANGAHTVGDLVAALLSLVAVNENRIIVCGRQLDLEQEDAKPISEVLGAARVIIVSPRYSLDTDVDTAFTTPGPVEQELMAQYDCLQSFLDGPPQVARNIFGLLMQLRPSTKARGRVSSADATASELFPPTTPWRTAFSSHVLQTHLKDFARLAVADEGFIIHGIRLFCAYIIDDQRVFDPQLLETILSDLLSFLQGMPVAESTLINRDRITDGDPEQSDEDSYTEIFEDPERLVARLYDLLRRVSQMTPSSSRGFLIAKTYETLLQAIRSDRRTWRALSSLDDAGLSQLHVQLLTDSDLALSTRLADVVTNFCEERSSPMDARTFYWRIHIQSIPHALERPLTSSPFFRLALDLLNINGAFQNDENAVRATIQTLVTELWQYNHLESPRFLSVDNGIAGLLRLLHGAIISLKSFKKPLGCSYLSVDLMRKLLFPLTEESSRPLLSNETRGIAFDIVEATCDGQDDKTNLAHMAISAMQSLNADPLYRFPGHDEWLKSPGQCAGLVNLGMTCYMNSLLQQMFANLAFRKLIFDTLIVDPERQSFLGAIQDLFTQMQEQSAFDISTKSLAGILNIQTDSQEDVHGFYAIFLSRLEDCMPDQAGKDALNKMFAGTFRSQVKGECGHVSTQTEAFNDVSITVKNKASLQESLAEFVQGEPMQGANKYRCMTCEPTNGGRLVNAMKRTALDQVPNNLTFCLKRFTFEAMMGAEGKVNDRFEFPPTIDMSKFEKEHLEQPGTPTAPDIFELVGVIVHQGSLQFGHYWSYVRLRGLDDGFGSGVWVQLEDKNARPCPGGIGEVQEQCVGGMVYTNGQERTDNAYVLFYQRQQHLNEQAQLTTSTSLPPEVSAMLPPRVAPPPEKEMTVFKDNLNRHRVDQLFDPQFSIFVHWLMGSLSRDTESNDMVAEVATAYLMRIVLCDPTLFKKHLTAFQATLTRRLGVCQTPFAESMLRHLLGLPTPFGLLWCHDSQAVRAEVSSFLLACLSSLRDGESSAYDELMEAVIRVHASVRGSHVDYKPSAWGDYVAFIVGIARSGPKETCMVLDQGYLDWAYEIILLEFDQNFATRHPLPSKKTRANQIELGALFNLLSGALAQHVDLEADPTPNSQPHQVSDEDKVILRHSEHRYLYLQYDTAKLPKVWLLGYIGSQRCSPTTHWENFPPGKLLRLISTHKAQYDHSSLVERMLLSRFEHESNLLIPLLHMTLHYCASVVDEELVEMFHEIGRNLVLWDCVVDCINFYENAFTFKPKAMIESITTFAPVFLLEQRSHKARQRTLDWLAEHAFIDAIPDDPYIVVRTRVARKLASICLPKLQQAYRMEHRRRPYEQAMGAMKLILVFLLSINSEWQSILRNAREDDDVDLPRDHAIEYDESKSTIKSLQMTLEELEDWMVEPVIGEESGGPATFGQFGSLMADDSEGEPGDSDLEDDEDVLSD